MGAQETGFDGTTRFSDYLPLADGTRLAYDLILPTIAGRPSEQPLPTLFKYTPYLRAYAIRGEQEKSRVAELYRMPPAQRAVLQDLDLFDPRHLTGWLAALVQQGYAAIVVERPGTGASFGTMDPTLAGTAREADQVLDWIAAQDWCNGRIGMWGNSWQGQTQLAAASTGNPHLKAIMPSATHMDAYGTCYQGGIYNQAFARFFVWSITILNSSIITPVDTDPDGSVLAQARAERAGSAVGQTMTDALWRAFPFRDSEIASGQPMWKYVSAYPLLDQINGAGVAVCLVAGWYDIFARDVFLLYRNLTLPKRLLVRPLDHSQIDATAPDLDYGAEVQRWFDHWLKGIDTGTMDEPAVRYYLLGAPVETAGMPPGSGLRCSRSPSSPSTQAPIMCWLHHRLPQQRAVTPTPSTTAPPPVRTPAGRRSTGSTPTATWPPTTPALSATPAPPSRHPCGPSATRSPVCGCPQQRPTWTSSPTSSRSTARAGPPTSPRAR